MAKSRELKGVSELKSQLKDARVEVNAQNKQFTTALKERLRPLLSGTKIALDEKELLYADDVKASVDDENILYVKFPLRGKTCGADPTGLIDRIQSEFEAAFANSGFKIAPRGNFSRYRDNNGYPTITIKTHIPDDYEELVEPLGHAIDLIQAKHLGAIISHETHGIKQQVFAAVLEAMNPEYAMDDGKHPIAANFTNNWLSEEKAHRLGQAILSNIISEHPSTTQQQVLEQLTSMLDADNKELKSFGVKMDYSEIPHIQLDAPITSPETPGAQVDANTVAGRSQKLTSQQPRQ